MRANTVMEKWEWTACCRRFGTENNRCAYTFKFWVLYIHTTWQCRGGRTATVIRGLLTAYIVEMEMQKIYQSAGLGKIIQEQAANSSQTLLENNGQERPTGKSRLYNPIRNSFNSILLHHWNLGHGIYLKFEIPFMI